MKNYITERATWNLKRVFYHFAEATKELQEGNPSMALWFTNEATQRIAELMQIKTLADCNNEQIDFMQITREAMKLAREEMKQEQNN